MGPLSRMVCVAACLASLISLVTINSTAVGDVIGYWRAEVDNDPGSTLNTPNEVAGGNPLVTSSASLYAAVPVNPIPLTGQPNTYSIEPNSGSIEGIINPYSGLDSDSITVEFFARTQEGSGNIITRTDNTSSGFVVTNYNSVDVTYYVDDGGGGSQAVTINTAHNMNENWDHMAWTYDQSTGMGRFFANGDEVGKSATATPGRALLWSGAGNVIIGHDMSGDGYPGGTFDELRISNEALNPHEMLNSFGPTLGHWRMETDTNSGTGVSTPNEVAAGNSMTSSAGFIDPETPPLYYKTPNLGAMSSTGDINGNVSQYGLLNSDSITVEFYARTTEGDADLVSRFNSTARQESGCIMDNTNALRLRYYVDDGAGGAQLVTASGLHNFNADWDHAAWTYDDLTGESKFYINGQMTWSNAGSETPGQKLIWDHAGNLKAGTRMSCDINPPDDPGHFDELRITGTVLQPHEMLNAFLQVDLGDLDQQVCHGFQEFSEDYNVDGPVSQVFDTVLGNAGTVTVTVDAEDTARTIDFRDRGNATYGTLGDLLEDHIKAYPCGVVLTLDDLAAGMYRMNTWHHDAARPTPDTRLDILVSDAAGTNRLLVDDLLMSGGTSPTYVASASFLILSDGINPITILFDDASGFPEVPLSGFGLARGVPEPATFLLLGLGTLGLLGCRRRRRGRVAPR